MDLKLQEITFPPFLWYIIPGFNFFAVDCLLPVALTDPTLLKHFASIGGIVIVFISALVVGYIMDSLKLYQLTFGYAKTRDASFDEISAALGLDRNTTLSILDAIRFGLAERGAFGKAVAFEHSRWVMINHTSKCFFLFTIIWFALALRAAAVGFVPFYQEAFGVKGVWTRLVCDALVIMLSLVIGVRLSRIAKHHHRLTGEKYLHYVRLYKAELLKELLGADHISRTGDTQ